jgi:hypothetical protein
MQTIKVCSRVSTDGKLQLQLSNQLANQEIETILAYQTVEPTQAQPPPTAVGVQEKVSWAY